MTRFLSLRTFSALTVVPCFTSILILCRQCCYGFGNEIIVFRDIFVCNVVISTEIYSWVQPNRFAGDAYALVDCSFHRNTGLTLFLSTGLNNGLW